MKTYRVRNASGYLIPRSFTRRCWAESARVAQIERHVSDGVIREEAEAHWLPIEEVACVARWTRAPRALLVRFAECVLRDEAPATDGVAPRCYAIPARSLAFAVARLEASGYALTPNRPL